jgi:hypothetical protein
MMNQPLVLIGVFTLLALPTLALSPPIPALEPVNWEADADARFKPQVEQVIVDRAQHRARQDDSTDAALWEGWGLEAMEPLRRILDDTRWEDAFKSQALDLMYACPLEGAAAKLAEELARKAERVAQEDDKPPLTFRIHLYAAAKRYPELLKPFLTHENIDVRNLAAEVLLGKLREITPEIATVIDAFATSDDPTTRNRAISLLLYAPSKANNARALEIAATISEDAVKGVRQRMENNAPRERAMEPMRLILEKEGK